MCVCVSMCEYVIVLVCVMSLVEYHQGPRNELSSSASVCVCICVCGCVYVCVYIYTHM